MLPIYQAVLIYIILGLGEMLFLAALAMIGWPPPTARAFPHPVRCRELDLFKVAPIPILFDRLGESEMAAGQCQKILEFVRARSSELHALLLTT